MLDDAYQHQAERMVLVSGDSDLVPAIRTIQERFPTIQVVVYVPARDPRRGAATELRTTQTGTRRYRSACSCAQSSPWWSAHPTEAS